MRARDLLGVKARVGELMAESPGLAGVEILSAYPNGRHIPLGGAALIISIDGIELTPAGLGGFGGEISGQGALLTLRLDFLSPGRDGPELYPFFEAAAASLTENGGRLGISRFWVQSLAWEEAANSYRLSANLALKGRGRCPEAYLE